jgi:hypothetical protein
LSPRSLAVQARSIRRNRNLSRAGPRARIFLNETHDVLIHQIIKLEKQLRLHEAQIVRIQIEINELKRGLYHHTKG